MVLIPSMLLMPVKGGAACGVFEWQMLETRQSVHGALEDIGKWVFFYAFYSIILWQFPVLLVLSLVWNSLRQKWCRLFAIHYLIVKKIDAREKETAISTKEALTLLRIVFITRQLNRVRFSSRFLRGQQDKKSEKELEDKNYAQDQHHNSCRFPFCSASSLVLKFFSFLIFSGLCFRFLFKLFKEINPRRYCYRHLRLHLIRVKLVGQLSIRLS